MSDALWGVAGTLAGTILGFGLSTWLQFRTETRRVKAIRSMIRSLLSRKD